MREESGRSLLEIIGVLSVGVIMTVAAYSMYKSIEQRQKNLIASEDIADIVKKAKLLYEYSGYHDISIEKLIEDGALSDARPPIGNSWSIEPKNNDTCFSIQFKNVPQSKCKYMKLKKINGVKGVRGQCSQSNSGQNSLIFLIDCGQDPDIELPSQTKSW